MNVIIIAVIALMVLVVLLFIFNDKLSIFGKGVSTCAGKCVDKPGRGQTEFEKCRNEQSPNSKPGIKYAYNPAGKCQDTKRICCIEVKIS